jgi:hypothetical protein
VSTVGTISSIHGSEKEAAMPNNRSLVKNIPRQQAAAKVVRHYPSEMVNKTGSSFNH